ncbi:MAG: hypothetical protein COW01_00515 [Bdellovibrionales bacterium CG12_big_fil_rev_8_21_14_0_65_38_15]|nr:MAG: hypothetical protein COW01_00515 [Bdellovibrionales bacterium CG12_big_fil_rev_8_21_14_0_65_38_15]PIR31170.1 MAG: hypothetical protein COV38_01995 [Bdellovibrionales bacterium CG11_big_fil_rev_8_21_14_0_20_38_13]
MNKLYESFEDLVHSHEALFKPHRKTSAFNVCQGVWEAREPEIQSLKLQLTSLKASYDSLDEQKQKQQEELDLEIQKLQRKIEAQTIQHQSLIDSSKKQIAILRSEIDAKTSTLNEVSTLLETTQNNLDRLQKYESSLDAVQRSQYSEIETYKKRFSAESKLRSEMEVALGQQQKSNEMLQLEVISKDDLITRLQARIDDLESRSKQQQRLNARMGVELDRFARENDQLTRAINQ